MKMINFIRCAVLCAIVICSTSIISAQIQQSSDPIQSYHGIKADMGTFYFKVQNPKEGMQMFTLELMDELRVEIENKRLDDQRFYWSYSEYTTIVIYSRNEINAANFVPVTELYQ
jgi:hypothetical protein